MSKTTTRNQNQSSPPPGASFWELFDFFWARGLGNIPHKDGSSTPWTAVALETAFDGTPDKRSIENWQARANMPSPDNLRRLSWIVAGEDSELRKAWHDALIAARLEEKRREREAAKIKDHISESDKPGADSIAPKPRSRVLLLVATVVTLCVGVVGWIVISNQATPTVDQIRICDQHYFDQQAKICTQHVSVFVHGVDEVFLSFEFKNVPDGMPFERWWIRNGERVAGRTSFNDDAWPGYTYWRPGVLPEGQYVVRIVVDGNVSTQTFLVQADGFIADS